MKSKTKKILVMSQLREIDLLDGTKNTMVIDEIRSDLLTRYGVRLDFDIRLLGDNTIELRFSMGYADPLDKDMMPEPMIWLIQGDGYKGFEPRYGIMIPHFPNMRVQIPYADFYDIYKSNNKDMGGNRIKSLDMNITPRLLTLRVQFG